MGIVFHSTTVENGFHGKNAVGVDFHGAADKLRLHLFIL
jgi:hypothetical protein